MRSVALIATALVMALSTFIALASDVHAQQVQYCSWCHGARGQGFATAPRLAGQKTKYIEKQLEAFIQHKRAGPFMWGAVNSLDVREARDLAVHFSAMAPVPAGDGDRSIEALGKAIYRQGIPASNIVACAACHGPNAQGIGDIPRLGGLSASYLKTRLDQWTHGNLAGASPPMPRIARQLSPSDIDALASYLSFAK